MQEHPQHRAETDPADDRAPRPYEPPAIVHSLPFESAVLAVESVCSTDPECTTDINTGDPC
ncbi:MAG: hypothetical protein ACOCXM_03780 [Myxococcota bacterium]